MYKLTTYTITKFLYITSPKRNDGFIHFVTPPHYLYTLPKKNLLPTSTFYPNLSAFDRLLSGSR